MKLLNKTLVIALCSLNINASDVALKTGWNLIGIDSTDPVSILTSNSHVLKAAGGGVGGGGNFRFDKAFAQYASGNMKLGQGYWIKTDSDTALTYTKSTQQPTSIKLLEGWNLINSCIELDAKKILETYPDVIKAAGGGVGGGGDFRYDKSFAQYASGITKVGQGYWFKVSKAFDITCDVTYDYRAWGMGGDGENSKLTVSINGVDYTLVAFSKLNIQKDSASTAGDSTTFTGKINGNEIADAFSISSDYNTEDIVIKIFNSTNTFTDSTLVAVSEPLTANNSYLSYNITIDNLLIIHNGTSYDTVTSPYTQRVWLDRNLGAIEVCTAESSSNCFGDYYQWGRDADGHEKLTSSTSSVLADDINNVGNSFIIGDIINDWSNADSDGSLRSNKWSSIDGSSICPTGFRVPTDTEIANEMKDVATATNSPKAALEGFLKLPSSGYRNIYDGSISNAGKQGYLWSGSIAGENYANTYRYIFAREEMGESVYSSLFTTSRANGIHVRCIKHIADTTAPTFTSSATASVEENQKGAITLIAIDEGSVVYSITGGDSASFDINTKTGIVTFKALPDYASKSSYTFKAVATDNTGNEAIQNITITILEVSLDDTTAPTFTSPVTISVKENQISAITLVATDDSQKITYSISGGDSADFRVNSETGIVTFRVMPDFETKTRYTFKATATDNSNNKTTIDITVTILDIKIESVTSRGITYGVVASPYTQRVWLDKNIGANQVCTDYNDASCFGDYYQWGRNTDGHEKTNSITSDSLASDTTSTGSSFITNPSLTKDWANTDENGEIRSTKWSSTDGSSICPIGFRVPTKEEVDKELNNFKTAVWKYKAAFNNFLKLPSAGYRSEKDASLKISTSGYMWTSSTLTNSANALRYFSDTYGIMKQYRARGYSVRCIGDNNIVHHDITYSRIVSPHTGKIWLDRNLGASQVCTAYNDTACYGDYYQWGRETDGHEKKTSATSTTQASDISNVGTNFIISSTYKWTSADVTAEQRYFKWKKSDGTSICPSGFRVPTSTELRVETTLASSPIKNNIDAFNSFLKLPTAGFRDCKTGNLLNEGTASAIWTNSVNNDNRDIAYDLYFQNDNAFVSKNYNSYGFGVRCIED